MKTKILIIVLLIGFSGVLAAQPAKNRPERSFREQGREMRMDKGQGGQMRGLNLTDAQKESFKQSMLALQKQLQPLRNELGEAEAHQKTLVTAEKPDLAAINKNIEKIGDMRVEMAKIQVKHRLDMRAQLTDEQRLKFDLFNEKIKHNKGSKGMKQNMKMQRQRGAN